MFAVYVIALLCLATVSCDHSALLDCANLTRPLDHLDPHHLEGTWALVAGSLSNPDHLEQFKRRDSASFSFTGSSETSTILLNRMSRIGENCHHKLSNITLEGNGFTFSEMNLTVTVLHTSCQDCAVKRFIDYETKKLVRLYLVSRRRGVEPQELEEFRAQAECLHMPAPVVMEPTKKLCPEHPADPAA